jgi:hypothetical protein
VCQTLSNAWLLSRNTAEQYFWASNALSIVSVSLWHCWIVECSLRKPMSPEVRRFSRIFDIIGKRLIGL